jgi:hypothetical protein
MLNTHGHVWILDVVVHVVDVVGTFIWRKDIYLFDNHQPKRNMYMSMYPISQLQLSGLAIFVSIENLAKSLAGPSPSER